jgi:hypothetical protein
LHWQAHIGFSYRTPHRAPAKGRTRLRFGALAAHAPPIRRLATLVTRRIRH